MDRTVGNHTTVLPSVPYARALGFKVETGKKAVEKISVPVLFGLNGIPEKSFEADAYHTELKTVVARA